MNEVVAPPPPPEELPAKPAPPFVLRGQAQNWHVLASLGIVGAIVALGVWAATSDSLVTAAGGRLPVWTFIGLAALLALFTTLMGWAITGHVAGALVDPRKGRLSLSRLQTLAWTILILAAYLNAFVVNIAAGRTNPLTVAIPGELLVAMGISITGLVGTQLVLGYKESQHGTATPGESATEENRQAVLRADRVLWSDVFKGDTLQGGEALDLGKIQLFYITLVLILGYGIFVGTSFAHVAAGAGGGIGSLPALDKAFVALLALSQGGYLTTKATS
jgi:hypothetical protein